MLFVWNSTISAINDCAKCINSRSQTDVILLDFSKAFDSVPHQRLLLKLDYCGICGKTAAWIKAFLGNRSRVVSVNGTHSSPWPVPSGPLYPKAQYWVLFYSYYILSILLIQSSQQCVSLQMTALCIERLRRILLQQDLASLCEWAETWQLNFNITKCYHLKLVFTSDGVGVRVVIRSVELMMI